ncbi:MBL fold metallo-hydrolase RNA specificity domain-containing protein, partial [uncultured Limosilactobacillus sp.]|uniref:MBL fold metallo-hydrolase RNA specificity domain-containing protein n=1 Tax=uncultured Limosilactobacillus sp. TaxID=2837629 RepID=UPI00351CEE47
MCAKILRLPGISGHADREGLIRWLSEISPKPGHVFVVHGEDSVCDSFCRLIREEYGQDATAAYSGA